MKVAVDQQHDREPDADFGGGDREHEQSEHLSGHARGSGVVQGAERDEVQVDRREHQLDAHEHEHRVLAGEHAVDAGAEEKRAEQEELVEEHKSLLASTTAPTRAPRSSTPTTSKGMM